MASEISSRQQQQQRELIARMEGKRPGSAERKAMLSDINKRLEQDKLRSNASIALVKSGQTCIAGCIARARPAALPDIPDVTVSAPDAAAKSAAAEDCGGPDNVEEKAIGPSEQAAPTDALAVVAQHETAIVAHSGTSAEQLLLEDIYMAQRRNKDGLADLTFGLEELIDFLQGCNMFDQWLTPRKVRVYFSALFQGCNYSTYCTPQDAPDFNVTPPANIEFPEFMDMLHWAADLKSMSHEACLQQMVQYGSAMSEKSSSMKARLEEVFSRFARVQTGRMSTLEFGCLCQRLNIYRGMTFTRADVQLLFLQRGQNGSVDFQGFLDMLIEVGRMLDMEGSIYRHVADAAEKLEMESCRQGSKESCYTKDGGEVN